MGTTSTSRFSVFPERFPALPKKTEPPRLALPHTPRPHYVCGRVWEKLRLAPRKSPKTPLNNTRYSLKTQGDQNGTHIQKADRSDRMGAVQRRRHRARIEEAVRRRPRDAELRSDQSIGDAAYPPAHQLQAGRLGRQRQARSLPLPEKPEYGLLNFEEPKPAPKDELERKTRIQWAKDFRLIADWLDANCYTTESEEA